MIRVGLIALVLLSSAGMAWGQTIVRGSVKDAQTGEMLPAANIQVAGTYRGTITNQDGEFELRLDELPATLIVRYIGYAEAQVAITASGSIRKDIRLTPIVYESETIVVTGENPAVRIMREVIERKKVWQAELTSYEAIAYNRFAVSNDTGIVSIMETMTQAFWDKSRGIREVLKARRETTNMEFESSLPAALFVQNLYDDDVDVGGHRLMGVTHPDALSEYRFTLAGTRKLDDHTVYDIDVRPKRRTKSAFVGRVSVLDSVFALIDVELAPGESFVFPPPLDHFNVAYRQQFSNFGGDYWLPVDFRAELGLKINFGLLLSFPDINIRQVSRFTDYEVNQMVPDSLFATDGILFVDSAAVKSDSLLDEEGAAVPLSADEQLAYVEIDSSLTMAEAFKPSGLFARFVEVDADTDESGPSRSEEPGESTEFPLEEFSAVPRVWYNRVDQFHLGADVSARLLKRVWLTAGAGYNVAPDSTDRWSYSVGGRLRLGPSSRVFVEAGYEVASVTRWESNLYGRILNSVVLALGGDDYYDYFRRDGFSVTVGYGFDWNRSTVSIGFREEDHSSLDQTVDRSPVGDGTLRPNQPIEAGRLQAISAVFSLGDRTQTYGATGANRIMIDIERGFGDFDYWRFAVVADARIPTFYRRRLIPNTLDVHVVAGTHALRLPVQRFGIVEGSMGMYRPFGGLRTLSRYPYEGDQWAGFLWEHSFRTIPFELLGLNWPARKSYNLILVGGHGRTWVSDPKKATNSMVSEGLRVSEQWHHEVGVSLSGLFGIARIDFAKRLDASGFTVGIAVAKIL